jgi:hypothetical protein
VAIASVAQPRAAGLGEERGFRGSTAVMSSDFFTVITLGGIA